MKRVSDEHVARAAWDECLGDLKDSDAIPLLARDLQEARKALSKIAALPLGHFTMTAQNIATEALR